MATKLSIIIVNWNVRGVLAQCLAAIEAEIGAPAAPAVECYVVDNASTDGSAAMIRAEFAWVQLIENSVNVGFATANNRAIAQSRGEYVMLLNPDTLVQPGAMATLLDFMDGHPAVGAVGPQLLNPDETFQVACFPAPTLTRELWRLLHLDRIYPYGTYRSERWSRTAPRPVDVIQGTCLLIRRSVLAQVGLLDEEYFMYTEEVDLCYRIRRAGWQVVWVPTAHVVHYGGQSTRQVAVEMFLRLYESKVTYFRKQHGPLAAQLYKQVLFLTGLVRMGGGGGGGLVNPTPRPRHQVVATHYRRLLSALAHM